MYITVHVEVLYEELSPHAQVRLRAAVRDAIAETFGFGKDDTVQAHQQQTLDDLADRCLKGRTVGLTV